MVVATALWGATFVVIRDSVRAFDPRALVFARFACASALFGVVLAVVRPRPGAGESAGGLFAGLAAALGFLLQAIGLVSTSAGSSAFLTCAGSLCSGFLAWLLLRERLAASVVAGVALALGGSALLTLRGGAAIGPGDAWTLAGSLAFALQTVALARFSPRANPLRLAFLQSVVAALALAPWAPDAVRALRTLPPDGLARFAYLVVAGSVAAPLAQVFAQRTLPAGRVGVLLALEPLFALVFALTVGDERFAWRWWIGAALILAGVIAVELPALRAEPSARRASG